MMIDDDLLEAYDSLGQIEQTLLVVMAVSCDSLTKTSIAKVLNKLGILTERGTRFLPKHIEPICDRLYAHGVFDYTKGKYTCVAELAHHCVKKTLQEDIFTQLAAIIEELDPPHPSYGGGLNFKTFPKYLRYLRLRIFQGTSEEEIDRLLSLGHRVFPAVIRKCSPVSFIFGAPFDAEIFSFVTPPLQPAIIGELLSEASSNLAPSTELTNFLNTAAKQKTTDLLSENLYHMLATHTLLMGDLGQSRQYIDLLPSESMAFQKKYLNGWHLTLQGEDQEAITQFEEALTMIKKETRKRKIFFQGIYGIFFLLALLRVREPQRLKEVTGYLDIIGKTKYHPLGEMADHLAKSVNLLKGQSLESGRMKGVLSGFDLQAPLGSLFLALSCFWRDKELCRDTYSKKLTTLGNRALGGGYPWLAFECATLLAQMDVSPQKNATLARQLQEEHGYTSISRAIASHEPWERSLLALINLASDHQPTKKAAAMASGRIRLAWRLFWDPLTSWADLEPRLQKEKANGQWTAGRKISLEKLSSDFELQQRLGAQDRAICGAISYQGRYYGYGFELEQALAALVGHPLIFRGDSPAFRVDLVKGEPELAISQGKEGIQLRMVPVLDSTEYNYSLLEETPTRFKYVCFSEQHKAIAQVLPKGAIKAPTGAEELTAKAIDALTGMIAIHSDFAGEAASARDVEADTTPHIHLIPYGDGLKVSLYVKPFPEAEAWHRPGLGGASVFAIAGEEKLHALRDLGLEKERAAALIDRCPTLARTPEQDGEFLVATSEESLELLLELRTLGDEAVVAWPRGESLKVSEVRSLDNLSLKINKSKNWFLATGSLDVDQKTVIDLQRLLEMLEGATGKFIRLDDGSFLALTQAFKSRLEELSLFGERQGGGVRFSPLAALAMEDLTSEAGSLAGDKHWLESVARFDEVVDAEPPSTFQAELRDYQLAGFKWLAQLSHWEVGACLADDMGLGKTIQALAAILLRAPKGPSLVVAPLSVLQNWHVEAARFAPTLRVVHFGKGDRRQVLDELQPFDLVVCSYGLLQSEEALLSQVTWQSVVLDEAQAIKNKNTKRAKAAFNLSGHFRMTTTGTPIENHLGDLWSLFHYLNPGLLGSFRNFQQKYMGPGKEREEERQTRVRLKKLIQPFILRRLKSQVLQELPARTEVTMQVEMSTEERALYEAQRLRSLEKIHAAAQQQEGGASHLTVLAEIMRLRRMCCNPAMVLKSPAVASSKLKVFGDVIGELIASRHKALVFSQFVDHLSIIARYLEKKGVSFQYLDGSTSEKKRQQRISAFQAGEGDVFLISLKAGGSGLNLTAADYVIHMDPWWNPAVEDQASDRAHRIGQTRPVTIYRLVMKESIEEQIVQLHHEKRDLADNLLAGTDTSAKLSADELVELLKEG